MPATFLVRYFQRHGLEWTLVDSIRRSVEFQAINLINDWPSLPTMDLVLIRNVLIYFDNEAKKQVLGRIAGHMASDGYLLLGGSETTFFCIELFERLDMDRCGVYQLKGKESGEVRTRGPRPAPIRSVGISRDRKYRKSLLGLAASSRPTPIHGRAVMENGEVDKLREAIETIWSTMLGMEVVPGVGRWPRNRNQPSFLTGCIQITGAWNVAVSVDCSGKSGADGSRATMFGVEFDQTTPDQVIDALGELVNIVSGNFKSFLPEPSQLSLPSVAEGTDYFFRVVGSRQLAKLTYTCQGEPFQITIVEGTK